MNKAPSSDHRFVTLCRPIQNRRVAARTRQHALGHISETAAGARRRHASTALPSFRPQTLTAGVTVICADTRSGARAHRSRQRTVGVYEDSPCFDGIYNFCQISAGGSLAGALRLNRGLCDVAINWAGGLHHAKKTEASGFCYINDCVLAILELLKHHARVLYCDIDVHHGDGVEEAFYTTDRVMTCSFHKFGNFFPGTGDVRDIGYGPGRHYALNFPLQDGVDDACFREIFTPIMSRVMEWYRPGAVVLQCGADSLSGDRLGCFNLSIEGHAECVRFFRRHGVPLMLLGGGGYTVRNVARCWAAETALTADMPLDDAIPYNPYYEYYGPEFQLHLRPSNMENLNTRPYLARIVTELLDSLYHLPHAPSVPYHDVPADVIQDPLLRKFGDDDDDSDEE